MDDSKREAIATFRFGLIAPVVTRKLTKGERQRILNELANQMYISPDATCERVSIRTLERYVAAYLKHGLEGLKPKSRKDAAIARAISHELLEKAVALKLEAPARSVQQIIRILELTGCAEEGILKVSTLSSHLYQHAKVKELVEGKTSTFRRYEMAYPNESWQADTHHTLYLSHPTLPNKRRLAYLIVFLDDFSRLITHGEFFFEENVLSLEQTLKKAILKHGIPEKLYVDNGAIYASQHLQGICARLNTHLIHAKPYRPQGKGKVERFFHYVDRSFKPEAYLLIEQGKLTTLDKLNEYFWAWLEKAYQMRIHGTTKEKPRVRFKEHAKDLRFIDPSLIDHYFLWEEHRTADSTGCIGLQGNLYELDLRLAKKKVTLRFDPKDLSRLEVWFEGTQYPDALPLKMTRQRHKALPEVAEVPAEPTGLNFLEASKTALAQEQTKALQNTLTFAKLRKEEKHD